MQVGGWQHPPLLNSRTNLHGQSYRQRISHTTHRVDQRRPDLWTCSPRRMTEQEVSFVRVGKFI